MKFRGKTCHSADYYTKPSVKPPWVGFWERLSVGERETSLEGGYLRAVRWAWWKSMWKTSRNKGMAAMDMAVPAISEANRKKGCDNL